MSPEFKAQWVAALRSGEYTQGYNHLRAKDPQGGYSYCCLGVACDLSKSGSWSEEAPWRWVHNNGTVWVGTLAPALLTELGLASSIPDKLIMMNDRDNKSFSEIADWIEENL